MQQIKNTRTLFIARCCLCVAIVLPVSTTSSGQPIYYSGNSLAYSPDYQYQVAGNVGGNIIVWKTSLKQDSKSEIYVYNNSMKLVRQASSGILHSDISPSPQFYVLNNTLLVFYQCKNQNSFLYKLARFDGMGNLLTDRVLDSLDARNILPLETFFYKVGRSENNKVVCFAKMHSDLENHVLNLNSSLISNDGITKENFAIPFDDEKETLADMIVDNNRNILLLKGATRNDSIHLVLVKTNNAGLPLQLARKSIALYGFEENSLHIAEKAGGYLVFGRVGKYYDTGIIRQTKLYLWQTGIDLKNNSDTIYNNAPGSNNTGFTVNSSPGDKPECMLVTWLVSGSGEYRGLYNWYNTSAQFGSYKFVYPGLKEYFFYYTGYTTPLGIYLPPTYNKVPEDYVKTPDTSAVNGLPPPLINKIEIFKLSNSNTIAWSHAFTDSIDNLTMANLYNARVVAGSKAVHILYEIRTRKKTTTLDHIAIYTDGSFSKGFVPAWNSKYSYKLNSCIVTEENELVIPAIRSGKIRFAKMKLE